VSKSAVEQSRNQLFRLIGNIVLKGRSEGVETFEALIQEQFETERVQQYLEAYESMHTSGKAGITLMLDLREKFVGDPLILAHARRLGAGAESSTIVMDEQ
jgi:adenylate cyclase